MGHIAHLRKQFKSINTYDYIITLIKRRDFLNFVNVFSLFRNYLPLEKGGTFIWINLNSHYQGNLYAKFGWNWPSCSWAEDFLNFVSVFPIFRNYLPLEEGGPFILKTLNSHQPGMICAKCFWTWLICSREDDTAKGKQTSGRKTGDQKRLLELSALVN